VARLIGRVARAFALLIVTVIVVVALGLAAGVMYARSVQVEDRVASAPKTGSYVDAYDTRIFLQKVGRDGAPAVVFVPGTGAWSENWRPFLDQVAARGYQAIAIDLPPFGYSVPPASGDYRKVTQGKRILSVLDSLGLKQATFVAHSIGSAPLMEALLAHPERVASVILIDPALGLDTPVTDGSDSGLQRLMRIEWIADALSATFLTNRAYTERLVKNFVTEKDKITPAWVGLFQRPMTSRGYYQGAALWLPELLAPRGTAISDDPKAYQAIRLPVTIVWGSDDTITPLSQGQHLQALIAGSSLRILPGGHVPMIEEPAALGRYLDDALPVEVEAPR
jgi:pimeloyl-ACP methyl ester carboxylesterase